MDVDLRRFEAASRDPAGLLDALGATAASLSMKNFEDQAFDGRPWPEAYEGREPRVRLANLVGSLLGGQKPPDRVLEGRPAGVYTNELYKSITHRVVSSGPEGGAVEVGSWLDYASRFQEGGKSTQPITPEVRDGLARWLDTIDPPEDRKIRRALRRDRKGKRAAQADIRALKGQRSNSAKKKRAKLRGKIDAYAAGIAQKRASLKDARSSPYRQAVGFLFGSDELVTNSVGRQFVGVSDELEKDLARQIETYFAKGGRA